MLSGISVARWTQASALIMDDEIKKKEEYLASLNRDISESEDIKKYLDDGREEYKRLEERIKLAKSLLEDLKAQQVIYGGIEKRVVEKEEELLQLKNTIRENERLLKNKEEEVRVHQALVKESEDIDGLLKTKRAERDSVESGVSSLRREDEGLRERIRNGKSEMAKIIEDITTAKKEIAACGDTLEGMRATLAKREEVEANIIGQLANIETKRKEFFENPLSIGYYVHELQRKIDKGEKFDVMATLLKITKSKQ